ncbi:hypothetical protein PR048_017952 [Dryococelus australis]|uniref:Uncharacterized protein n=1 Tax=Dryococelus australis TaxID=614101 RepID=A0ABQ9HB30_9NEOP|nr:hypothetical protein PR048_017952 [Dryococelus australis]
MGHSPCLTQLSCPAAQQKKHVVKCERPSVLPHQVRAYLSAGIAWNGSSIATALCIKTDITRKMLKSTQSQKWRCYEKGAKLKKVKIDGCELLDTLNTVANRDFILQSALPKATQDPELRYTTTAMNMSQEEMLLSNKGAIMMIQVGGESITTEIFGPAGQYWLAKQQAIIGDQQGKVYLGTEKQRSITWMEPERNETQQGIMGLEVNHQLDIPAEVQLVVILNMHMF